MATDRAKRQMAMWKRLGWTEKVIYRPARAGIMPREIDAVVVRPGTRDTLNTVSPAFTVTVLNDQADGVPSDDRLSDLGKDRIEVAKRMGGPRTPRGIDHVAEQDQDFLTLEIM